MRQLSILRPLWLFQKSRPRVEVGTGRHHPRAFLAENFALVAGALLVLSASLWAVGEHARHRAALRMVETNRYIAQFQDPPVADAWQRLTRVWQAERARQDALLARVVGRSGAARVAQLRNYRAFVIDTVTDHGLMRDVDTVLRFYRRLALCIRVGGCDPARASSRFGRAAWAFRNLHYYYLREVSRIDEIDRALDVIAPREDEPKGTPS